MGLVDGNAGTRLDPAVVVSAPDVWRDNVPEQTRGEVVVTETKIVMTYIDTRGRMRTQTGTLSREDMKRVLDLLDEVFK
jgi:hypothetical protein